MKWNSSLICLFGILISIPVFSQNDSVRYHYILDDPYQAANWSFYLTPVDFRMSALNIIGVGLGVGVDGSVTEKIKLRVEYFRAIFDINSYQDAIQQEYVHLDFPSVSIDQKFKPLSSFELGTGYVISDKSRTEKINIALASSQTGNLIITKVIPIDHERRRVQIIRGGVMQYTSKYNLYQSAEGSFIEANDGTRFHSFGGISYTDVDYKPEQYNEDWDKTPVESPDSFGEKDWNTQFTGTTAYIGFSSSTIRNLVVKTDYGIRGSRSKSTVYADLMVGLNLQVDPITFFTSDTLNPSNIGVTSKEFIIDWNGSNAVQMIPVGFRLGFEAQGIAPGKSRKFEDTESTSRLFSLKYKMEVGMLPGPRLKTFFFNVGISWPVFNASL